MDKQINYEKRCKEYEDLCLTFAEFIYKTAADQMKIEDLLDFTRSVLKDDIKKVLEHKYIVKDIDYNVYTGDFDPLEESIGSYED